MEFWCDWVFVRKRLWFCWSSSMFPKTHAHLFQQGGKMGLEKTSSVLSHLPQVLEWSARSLEQLRCLPPLGAGRRCPQLPERKVDFITGMQAGSRAPNGVSYSRYEFSIPLCTFRASLNVGKTVLKGLPVTWGDNGIKCRSPRGGRVSPPRVQTSGLAQLEKLPTQPPWVEGQGTMNPQGGLGHWRKMAPVGTRRKAATWQGFSAGPCWCQASLNQAPWRSEVYMQDGWVQEKNKVPPHTGAKSMTKRTSSCLNVAPLESPFWLDHVGDLLFQDSIVQFPLTKKDSAEILL